MSKGAGPGTRDRGFGALRWARGARVGASPRRTLAAEPEITWSLLPGAGAHQRLRPLRGSRRQGRGFGMNEALIITKGSALEIPRRTDDAETRGRDFKGRALGYEIAGAPNVPACVDRRRWFPPVVWRM